MGKPLVALLAVVSMSFSNDGLQTMSNLTIRPSPPVQGQSATITGTAGDVIDLDWDPAAEPSSITLGADGKATFVVPANATSLIATAPDGSTEAWVVRRP